MKKILWVLLVIAIAILMAACFNSNEEITPENVDVVVNNEPENTDIINSEPEDVNSDSHEDINIYYDINDPMTQKIVNYRKSRGEYIPAFIDITYEDETTVSVHLYDVVDDHVATTDWYTFDSTTGVGTHVLGEEINLNVQ